MKRAPKKKRGRPILTAAERKERRKQLREKQRKDIADEVYVIVSISTYPEDLKQLDAVVEEVRKRGDRKASRSSVIRAAVAMYRQWMGLE